MKLHSLRVVILVLALHLALQQTLVVEMVNATTTTMPTVPAVIVFGDSIVDPGNNNVIKTIIKCNFPPYGVDFADHRPTGRFCDGKIPTDFIASKLGVKELLPPYLGTYLNPQDLLTGVSFASGGTGFDLSLQRSRTYEYLSLSTLPYINYNNAHALSYVSKTSSVLSMPDQLELFKEYKEKLKSIAGEKRASGIVSQSLYVDLIGLGARKIGFVGIPPIGCVPSQRTLAGGALRNCAGGHNEIANLYNNGLIKEIERINKKHRHNENSTVVYIDIYTILFDMIQRPNHYGFKVSNKGCCGTGDVEVSVLCNGLTSTICEDVSEYVFWDSYHPTQRAYEVLVDWESTILFPITNI
ncbi:GDSL esterase/lipase EXL3 [Ananas comosus]|uniref:GDSL esterase/lipase EXL3 n=1 Tax=Ananas comosus TaxID=4615 RepID=A0A199VLN7_ANACO|nr:GDSL esterase/lipase EXL3 [Ananas comosus]